MYFLDQNSLQATVVKLYWQIKAKINLKKQKKERKEINHRKRNEKKMITWRLNNMLLKNQWINKKIKKEIKIP